ncbi:MAG TPA: DUF2382 domain-containing protein [Allosphingosinicella sp.]|jgi:hypothetical protein
MSATVSSRFADFAKAESALLRLDREVGLIDSLIVSGAEDRAPLFDAFGLPDDARAACEEQLAGGGWLLIVRVAEQRTADLVLDLLDAYAAEPPEAAAVAQADRAEAEEPLEPKSETGSAPMEELRIGAPMLVRGRARVTVKAEAPAEAATAVEEAPSAHRRIAPAELSGAGLFEERTIEVGETREKPVVSKSLFVREELVVRKSGTERIERFADSVRRTEVEVEELPPTERAGAAAAAES